MAAFEAIPVVFLGWRLTSGAGSHHNTDAAAIVACAAVVAAMIALLCAYRRGGAIARGWMAIAAGTSLWAGSIYAITTGDLISESPSRLSVFHLGWAGLSIALAAGIVLLGLPERDPEARRKLVLDLMPIGIALSIAVWLAVFGPSAIDRRSTWEARGAEAIHAGGALLLLVAALVGVLRRSRLDRPIGGRLLAGGAVIFAVADLLWLLPWRRDGVDSHPAAELCFLLGFLLLAVAGLKTCAGARAPESEAPVQSPRRTSDWLHQAPHISLFVLLALAGGQLVGGDLQPHGAETAIAGSLAVVALAMMRQTIALRHARKLHGEIGHLTEQIDGLIEQVGRDPLTGLLNRRAALGRIDHEVAHGKTCGHPVAVVLIDVDNFKTVNDTLGHQSGDRVLLAVGSILNAACRGTDVAARYAGDEFLLVLPGLNEAHASQVCERIVQDVRNLAVDLNLGGVRVTLSVGAAVTHHCKRTATQLIAIADAAMYDAKEGGKDRVVAVDADTLLSPGAASAPPSDSVVEVTYLPSGIRAIRNRRGLELSDRAS